MNESDIKSMIKLDVPVPPKAVFEKALGITNTYNMRYWTIGVINKLPDLRQDTKAEYTDGKTIIYIDAYGYYAYCKHPAVWEKLKPYIFPNEPLYFLIDLEHSNAYIANHDQFIQCMTAQWEDNPEADKAQRERVKIQSEFELMVNPEKKITFDEFVSGDIGAEEFIEMEIGKGIVEMTAWFEAL